ncbi:MAG: CvpA family protein [Fibrobacter sp.]|nr:CvpA family protein [Fibrobacter sp.]
MNAIDIICLVIILLFTLLGLWHGLLRGIFRLLAWAAAIAGAYFANSLLSEKVAEFLETSDFSATLVCICIGFLVPFLGFLFISHIINKSISGTAAGKADRILGGVFGAIKAILICFVILTILHILPFGGVLHEKRDNALAYSTYKCALKLFGYSTEPVDLVGVAERKASEFTKSLTDRAAEKANEVAKEATEKASEAAKDAIKEATDKAAESAKEAAKDVIEKAAETASEKASAAAKTVKDAAETAKNAAKTATEDIAK